MGHGKDSDVHQVVVGGVRRGSQHEPAGDGGRPRAALDRTMEQERENRNEPAGEEIEMSEEVHGKIRRGAEHDARQNGRASMMRDRPGEPVHARHVRFIDLD